MTTTMTVEAIRGKIIDVLRNMCDENIMVIHNEYCESIGCEQRVYWMEEFNDICGDMTAWEVVRAAHFGEFNPCDAFFYFNRYGNLESLDWLRSQRSPIDIVGIADYIIENEDNLYNDEITDIIDNDY